MRTNQLCFPLPPLSPHRKHTAVGTSPSPWRACDELVTDGKASAGCCRVWWELNPGTVEEVSCCAPLPSKEELVRKTSPPFPLALPTSSGMEWELMGRCSTPSRHWTQASVADMLKSPPDWILLFCFDLKPPTVLT